MAHKIFVMFLILVGCCAALAVGLRGYAYYVTPLNERAFLPEYKELRSSSIYSHGLGVLGATMITVGVITYSSCKRFRALWTPGKLSMWVEKLFYYWHAIHLPFTAMRFITLVVHIGVSLWLVYRWMF